MESHNLKNTFSIKSVYQNCYFIANRETGKWVLADHNHKQIKNQLSTQFVRKPFLGTSLIALNMGRPCNFNCIYCLVGELRRNSTLLDMDTALKTLNRILELNPDTGHIVFHGSEPMMNFPVIKELVSYARRRNNNITFSLQSNGSLFTDENLQFLVDNKVGIGISLDGLEQHQNKHRPFNNGLPTYEKVIRGIEAVQKYQGNLSVITVISKHNVKELSEIVSFYEKLGIDSVLFCPVNPTISFKDTPSCEDLITGMKNVFDNYIYKLHLAKKPVRINNFRSYMRTFFRPKTTTNCLQCGAGEYHPLLAIDINGSIYPCDYFWGNETYKLGDVFNTALADVLNSPRNFRVYRNVDNTDDCVHCNWKLFCGGGCFGSTVSRGAKLSSKSIYCSYTKAMLEYVAERIAWLHSNRMILDLIDLRGAQWLPNIRSK